MIWKRRNCIASDVDRRQFIGAAAAATAFTIVPSHVLGGQGVVAPSDKVTVGYIGCGTEGLLEFMAMLTIPEVQIVATCDPMKDGNNYLDFGMGGPAAAETGRVKGGIRSFLGKPGWRANQSGIPGGRDVGKELAETYYAQFQPNEKFSGVATYADFRELLAKQNSGRCQDYDPGSFARDHRDRGDEEGQTRSGAQADRQPDERS